MTRMQYGGVGRGNVHASASTFPKWVTRMVVGMQGLGDNIYQVPVVKMLCEQGPIVLQTPWPQLYSGIGNLTLVAPRNVTLRTQNKNVARAANYFSQTIPPSAHRLQISYSPLQRQRIPLFRGLCMSAGVDANKYYLDLGREYRPGKHVVVRPCVVRAEWNAPGRNCHPQAVQDAIDWCNAKGLETILIADICPPHEIYHGPRPVGVTRYYEYGELSLEQVLELIGTSRFTVGPIGFIVPMCIALGVPCLILHGGGGGFSNPHMIDAPGKRPLHHFLPKNYCQCLSYTHNCDKTYDKELLHEKLERVYMVLEEGNRISATQEAVPVR
jgi:hypothetical protein